MADIKITCNSCGNVLTVSEFADPASIACRQCGEFLQKPIVPLSAQEKASLPKLKAKVTTPKIVPKPGSQEEEQSGQWRIMKDSKQNPPEVAGSHMKHLIGSWIVFVVLGAGSWYLKYHGILEANDLIQYSPYLLLTFHIAITLKAFKDSIFSGALCLFVPVYSFYYLFMICDDFYMRAVIAGLLVGTAEDSAFFYNEKFTYIFDVVTKWIQSGG